MLRGSVVRGRHVTTLQRITWGPIITPPNFTVWRKYYGPNVVDPGEKDWVFPRLVVCEDPVVLPVEFLLPRELERHRRVNREEVHSPLIQIRVTGHIGDNQYPVSLWDFHDFLLHQGYSGLREIAVYPAPARIVEISTALVGGASERIVISIACAV